MPDADGERTADELLADPEIRAALKRLGKRSQGLCPRCMKARIASNSPHGFCQPCTTEHDERIKASRRRSYHRNKQLPTRSYGPTGTDADRQEPTDADDKGVVVGDQGWKLLTVQETAALLSTTTRTVERMIAGGKLRSIKIGKLRRVPADAIADLLERAEAAS